MITLQQLRTACAVAESGFNLSRAAELLRTTQPAVSKTIKGIESGLGAAVFIRSSTRIVGLTELGENLTNRARGIQRELAGVMELARESSKTTRGVLTIATTHSCARYLLPPVARLFANRYPEVALAIEQADARTIAGWVAEGKVLLGITAVPQPEHSVLVALKARDFSHCIIAPPGHDILSKNPPTIVDLAAYPMVIYSQGVAAGSDLNSVLRYHGHTPQVAVIARDASVVKAHVSCGLGIGVIQSIAVEPEDNDRFGLVDASHLLPPASFHVVFRRDQYFRSYIYDFIEMFAPQWTRERVQQRLSESSSCAK